MKKVLIIIISIISIFFCIITIYKFAMYKDTEQTNNIEEIDISVDKFNFKTEKLDKETYQANVINEKILKYDYVLNINGVELKGNIYLDKDGYLYFTDSLNDLTQKVSDVKFDTLYLKSNELISNNLYGISKDKKLYTIFLGEINLKSVEVILMDSVSNVQAFTNLEVETKEFMPNLNVVVLLEDGNMYEAQTGIRYSEKLYSLFPDYYIYDNSTIISKYGTELKDKEGNGYKIKHNVDFYDNDTPIYENVYSMITTTNNEVIYIDESGKYKVIDYSDYKIEYQKEANNVVTINFIKNNKIEKTVKGHYYEQFGF